MDILLPTRVRRPVVYSYDEIGTNFGPLTSIEEEYNWQDRLSVQRITWTPLALSDDETAAYPPVPYIVQAKMKIGGPGSDAKVTFNTPTLPGSKVFYYAQTNAAVDWFVPTDPPYTILFGGGFTSNNTALLYVFAGGSTFGQDVNNWHSATASIAWAVEIRNVDTFDLHSSTIPVTQTNPSITGTPAHIGIPQVILAGFSQFGTATYSAPSASFAALPATALSVQVSGLASSMTQRVDSSISGSPITTGVTTSDGSLTTNDFMYSFYSFSSMAPVIDDDSLFWGNYMPNGLTETISWTPFVQTDDEILSGAVNFFLEQEESWPGAGEPARVLQSITWTPLAIIDDEIFFVTPVPFYLDDTEPWMANTQRVDWYYPAFVDLADVRVTPRFFEEPDRDWQEFTASAVVRGQWLRATTYQVYQQEADDSNNMAPLFVHGPITLVEGRGYAPGLKNASGYIPGLKG
jgi:hypothetical protein